MSSPTSVSGRMPKSVVSDPCGSVSITSTLWPRMLRPWASTIEVVVLPTPPLKLPTATVAARRAVGRIDDVRCARAHFCISTSENSLRPPLRATLPDGKSRLSVIEALEMPQMAATRSAANAGATFRASGINRRPRMAATISAARSASAVMRCMSMRGSDCNGVAPETRFPSGPVAR